MNNREGVRLEGASLIFNLGGWWNMIYPFLTKCQPSPGAKTLPQKGKGRGFNLKIYIPRTQMTRLFWSEFRPCLGGIYLQQIEVIWGSRYISVAISWYFTTSYEIKGTLKQLYHPVVLEYFGRTFMYIMHIFIYVLPLYICSYCVYIYIQIRLIYMINTWPNQIQNVHPSHATDIVRFGSWRSQCC